MSQVCMSFSYTLYSMCRTWDFGLQSQLRCRTEASTEVKASMPETQASSSEKTKAAEATATLKVEEAGASPEWMSGELLSI